jgi:hypothetical protein
MIKNFEPDMITVITSKLDQINSERIQTCLHAFKNIKAELIPLDPVGVVDSLREARTQNMSCTVVGQIQTPLLYQVRFTNFSAETDSDELATCISLALQARNKVIHTQPPGNTAI